jgi:YggT family protein
MMILIIVRLINLLANTLILLVIVDAVISYFLSPYHPVRVALDRIVNPLLSQIRRVVPPLGMLDLSPLVLIVLIEILSFALTSFFYAI